MAELPFSLQKTTQIKPLKPPREGLGVLFFSGIVLLLIAVFLFAGVFLYKQYLNGQIKDLSASLKRIEADFQAPLIEQLAEVAKKIDAAKSALSAHRSPSGALQFLEDNTLDSSAFSSFNLAVKNESLSMTGESKSYTSLAQQLAVLEQNPLIKSVALSNPALEETGKISFAVSIIFNPGVFTFR